MQEWGEREQQEIAALIKHFRKNGLWKPDRNITDDYYRRAPLLVKNTEANVIPAYGCMEVLGTVDETSNYIRVKKPTSSGTLFLFNDHSEIEANGYGVAQQGPVFRAYKSSGTITLGNRWAPTAGQYYLSKGPGPYVVIGLDDIGTDVFRLVEDDGIRLYRFTLNVDFSSGTADSDILEMDGTDTNLDKDVLDPLGIFDTLVAEDAGICVLQNGKYYAIQAPCSADSARPGSSGVASITSNYSLSILESGALANATGGAITVFLPTASDADDVTFFVKKTDGSANTVTINPDGSETIDGASTKVISTQYETVYFVSDGTQWWVI